MSFDTPTRANSLAVGDLDGDGRPDVYAALANVDDCEQQFSLNGSMTDRWPDLVLSSMGQPVGRFRPVTLSSEPTARGCSWLATWAGPGLIHLGRGTEVAAGDSYVLRFRAARLGPAR